MKILNFLLLVALAIIFTGCGISSVKMVQLEGSSLETRQLQSRSYQTNDEAQILTASLATLQDTGFHIEESNIDFGVLSSSKTIEARETAQQVGYILLSILTLSDVTFNADHTQKISATLVTSPRGNNRVDVRLNVQRFIYNNRGWLLRIETITEPQVYKDFFAKLSKSIFLEANSI